MPGSTKRCTRSMGDQLCTTKGAKFVVVAGHSLGANTSPWLRLIKGWRQRDYCAQLPPTRRSCRGLSNEWRKTLSRAENSGRDRKRKRETPLFRRKSRAKVSRLRRPRRSTSAGLTRTGPPVMPKSAASFKAPTPLLLVVGSGDYAEKVPFSTRHHHTQKADSTIRARRPLPRYRARR